MENKKTGQGFSFSSSKLRRRPIELNSRKIRKHFSDKLNDMEQERRSLKQRKCFFSVRFLLLLPSSLLELLIIHRFGNAHLHIFNEKVLLGVLCQIDMITYSSILSPDKAKIGKNPFITRQMAEAPNDRMPPYTLEMSRINGFL